MNPFHTTTNLEDIKNLFEQTPIAIKNLIKGGEVGDTTTTIGKMNNLPIANYTLLSNIITCGTYLSMNIFNRPQRTI